MELEISSDSSDTIILSSNTDNNEPSDTEIENILKKYSATSGSVDSKVSNSSFNKFYDLDDFSDEDLVDEPLIKRIKNSDKNIQCICQDSVIEDMKFNDDVFKINQKPDDISIKLKMLRSKYCLENKSSVAEANVAVVSDSSDSEPNNEGLSEKNVIEDKGDNNLCFYEDIPPSSSQKERSIPKKRQKDAEIRRAETVRAKERKRQEVEAKKTTRILEKQKKKEMREQQKALKTALKSVERSTNKDECIKYVTVEFDNEILKNDYVNALKTVLGEKNIPFKFTSQIFPKLISWSRNMPTIEDLSIKTKEFKENNFLLIMDLKEFASLVHNNSLTSHIHEVLALTLSKQLTVAILGADKPKPDQDLAITQAQIFTKSYFRFTKKEEGLATLLMELTKAVAQLPYKLKQEEKYMLHSEYFNDFNKDNVKVDKNGNGLSRLWHQMFTMFPLVRLETAETIAAAYPTPSALFKAYETCTTKKEELLANLAVRRAVGPCATVRRVGPELSRKCFNFFCSEDNVLL